MEPKFLKPFYDITTLFSGSSYPTANLYFNGVRKIQLLIMEETQNPEDVISSMAKMMKKTFDKYWECYSTVLSFAIVLDPRYKLQLIEFCFKKVNLVTYLDAVKIIREKLYLLFEEYVHRAPVPSNPSSSSGDNESNVFDDMDVRIFS